MPTTNCTQSDARVRPHVKVLLWICLFLSTGVFIWRGPVRNLQPTNWNDLAQNYAAARLWLRGENFARPENFEKLWTKEVGESVGGRRNHLAPPPGTLVLMAPIGALSWPSARLAWLVVLIAATLATIWSLAKVAGFKAGEPRLIGFVAFCLALAPFHTGIAVANQTVLIVGLCALGILAASSGQDVVPGVLFGVACSLKPQLGSFIVLHYLMRKRWCLFGTALLSTGLLASVAILWLNFHNISWAHDYFSNLKVLATQNKIDDFTSVNPIRFMLINLQVLFYSFTRNAVSANILALCTGSLLIIIWMYFMLRTVGHAADRLSVAAISTIALLPLYHRLYDAAILSIPVCWSISEMSGERRTIARTALTLTVPFLLPGAAMLQELTRRGLFPSSWVSSWWWEALVMPHQTWLLLLLALTLLYGLGQEPWHARRCLPKLG
jgi:hypothetical protein